MPKYVTPSGYARSYESYADPGSAAFSTLMLAEMIARAEAAIDAYLQFPLHFGGGFEPHIIYAQRGFNIYTRRFPQPMGPVPVRNIQRYRIHVSNVGSSGAGFYATLNNGDAVINQTEGYIEVVPLQATTYALTPILVQLGLQPPIAEVDMEVGFYLSSLAEPLYEVDSDNSHTVYGAVSTKQFWAATYTQAISDQPNTLPPVPPVVYKNGSPISSSLYTVNYSEGTLLFSPALLSTDVVTADITNVIPTVVAEATIAQTTYLIQQRLLNQLGLGGLELARSGGREVRRARTDDVVEDELCAKARGKLAHYRSIAIA